MARDHRKAIPQRAAKRYPVQSSQRSAGSVKWVLLGLLLGLLVSFMGYWHFHTATNTPNMRQPSVHPPKKIVQTAAPAVGHTPQFDFYTVLPKMQADASVPNQQPQPKPVPPSAKTEPLAPTAATVATQTANAQQKVLGIIPDEEEPSPVDQAPSAPSITAAAKPTPATHKTPMPEDTVATPAKAESATTSKTGHFLLQVASVKNYAEADRYKAQLSMLGFDVNIQKYMFNGQVWHRVNIGPFASRQTALEQQGRLKENGISSILVKQT